ncbi:MAG: DUF58 domain-containing protein [Chloroflexi bacterium]|nr:DUF58 domain-containing protein [Chloroflexota bacterium]
MPNLLLFLLGVLLFAAFFRYDFIFYVLYVFFFIYIGARFWVRAVVKRIQIERQYEPRALHGEKQVVTVKVHNRSWLPIPYMRLHESAPIQLKMPNFERAVVSLRARESAELSYTLDCRQRGYYELGPLTLEVGDLFGIYREERQITTGDHIAVYPRIVPLQDLRLPAQTPYGTIKRPQSLMQDPSRMMGVCPYQSGDSMRHIHWKMTASSGQLQVKRFEPAISIEAQLYLNLNRSEYTTQRASQASELAIVTTASFVSLLTAQRQTVGFTSNGYDPLVGEHKAVHLPSARGEAQQTAILDILARIQLTEAAPFEELLRRARLNLRWGGTSVVITPHASDALVDTLLLLKRSGLNVVLILVDPQSTFTVIVRRMEQAGIQAFQVWQERDLDIWR